jgi:apolipoprotein N-acyltransferase
MRLELFYSTLSETCTSHLAQIFGVNVVALVVVVVVAVVAVVALRTAAEREGCYLG